MPILGHTTGLIGVDGLSYPDVAQDAYAFHGIRLYLIRQLEQLSVSEAKYDFSPSQRPIDTDNCLKKIQDEWMTEKQVPILLLSGPQGTGKSTFARAIASACLNVANYPVISFCFSHGHSRRSDLHRVIPTLAEQLHKLTALPGLKETVEENLSDDPFMWIRPLGRQFVNLVIRPIYVSLDHGPHSDLTYVILLDGIDACEDYGALKQFLSDIKPIIDDLAYSGRIKILCTSRDVPAVHAAFRSLLNYCRVISTQPGARKNILKYLSDATQDVSECTKLHWDLINDHIADKSAGNFVRAANLLQDFKTSNCRLEDIQEKIKATAPQSLSTNSFTELRQRNAQSVTDTSPLTTSPLDALLNILRGKGPDQSVITAVNPGTVNPSTIKFLADLLGTNDYMDIPSKICDDQDALNLLNFIIYLLDLQLLNAATLQHGNRRARRLMLKLAIKANVIPPSVLIAKEDVTIANKLPIGYGGFGNVHEGTYRGHRVAIKILHSRTIDKSLIREVSAWKTISHQYVLPFIGTYVDSDGSIHLVSPFMENGTLSRWRHGLEDFSAVVVREKILQVAEGTQYLHYEGVIHCDLRGDNILLDYDSHVRIADFGLSRDLNATSTGNRACSKHFAAPELISVEQDQMKFTEKTDVYAFGCLYYEIHFGLLPFKHLNPFVMVERVKNGDRPLRRSDPRLDDKAWDLIQTCWDQNPGKRPTIDGVVEIMISQS